MKRNEYQYTSMTIGLVSDIRISEIVYDDGTFGQFIRVEDDNGNVFNFTLNTDKPRSAAIVIEPKRSPRKDD